MNNPWEITIHKTNEDELDCLNISLERRAELSCLLKEIIEDTTYPSTVEKYLLISQQTKTANENAFLLSFFGRVQMLVELEEEKQLTSS